MDLETIKQMEKFEKTYWWHIGKKNLVVDVAKTFIPKLNKTNPKLLEIGSGAGEITHALAEYGEVYANDISQDALDFCKQKGIDNLILGDINNISLDDYNGTFDMVFALDVLEHIQDDIETIKRVNKLLTPEGYFVINVPAYKFLWSIHDEALQHKRRYASYEMRQKLIDNGFEIVKESYFVFFVFPVIAFFKVLSNFIDRSPYPKTSYVILPDSLNSFMVKLLNIEISIARNHRLPFGTTFTIIAKKA